MVLISSKHHNMHGLELSGTYKVSHKIYPGDEGAHPLTSPLSIHPDRKEERLRKTREVREDRNARRYFQLTQRKHRSDTFFCRPLSQQGERWHTHTYAHPHEDTHTQTFRSPTYSSVNKFDSPHCMVSMLHTKLTCTNTTNKQKCRK